MAFIDALGARDQTSLLSVAEADTLAADSFDGTEWTGLTTAQKQGSLVEATRVLETFHFLGERVWPELQALQWPREGINEPDLRFEVQGHIHHSTLNRVLDREQRSITQEGSASDVTIVSASLIGQDYEPDDFWVNGSVRVEARGLATSDEVRRVADFDASTGTLTVAAFSAAIATGTALNLIQEIHPTVKQVVYHLALMVAREGAGWVDRKENKDPYVLMTGIVDRFLRGIRRRSFNVV